MAGVFDFLHIKKNTAGSSNELSFDVLEQKSVEADEKSPRGAKAGLNAAPSPAVKTPNASKGTYHGVTGASTLSGQAEVEKRKRARQANRIRAAIAAGVVMAAVVAAAVFLLSGIHSVQEDHTAHIAELVERVNGADETVFEIDALMMNPFDEGKAAERTKALASIPKLTAELNRVSVDAHALVGQPLGDTSKILVDQLGKAAQARNGMLAAAAEAFRLSSEATEQVNHANTVWNDVLKADQQAREAIAEANKATTPEATTQALELMWSSIEGFARARGELQEMSALHGIDFAAQEAYLSKRIESLEKAAETSEALLAGNREAANAANEAYNAIDAEAAKLAQDLPPSIGGIVHERFERDMAALQQRYEEARDKAIEIDSVIRQYLD